MEVLLHCSKESVKNAATEAAKPAGQGEKGEMQVRTRYTRCYFYSKASTGGVFISCIINTQCVDLSRCALRLGVSRDTLDLNMCLGRLTVCVCNINTFVVRQIVRF